MVLQKITAALYYSKLLSCIWWTALYPALSNANTPRYLLSNILNGTYDINFWPHSEFGVATDVDVQIFVNSFGSLDATHMDYHLDVFLRQQWRDPRLSISSLNFSKITIQDEDVRQSIWKPDTFFENVKDASFHEITTPNVLFRIDSNGHILYSVRINLKVSCFMNLREYPMDTQRCLLTLSSYSNTIDVINYRWVKENPIDIAEDVQMSQFELLFKEAKEEVFTYSTGNFSGLRAIFVLQRQMGYHILQTYIPTLLIVSISWVSFWLDPNAVPGRVTLGVTTLLTLTTLAAGIRQNLPPVSYVKSIDIWIGMCMIMVFGALLEFTFSNWLANKKNFSRKSSFKIPKCLRMCYVPEQAENDQEMSGEEPTVATRPEAKSPSTYIKHARAVDRISRFLFPSTFFIFNLIYWSYYATEHIKNKGLAKNMSF